MADSTVIPSSLDEFFRRWEASGAAERANYSMFLNELCDLLEVPQPDPAGPDDERNAYVFERAVPFPNPDGSTTVKRRHWFRVQGMFNRREQLKQEQRLLFWAMSDRDSMKKRKEADRKSVV